ncbi:tRNA (adenosine(37)-N6)-threonylcarbamoyltransferase complex dimerization subunit type 1 TsaB [Candidatus Aquiluna sp. IMCC13023]|uniref:tRNA (adenosine(37)-N6)-threonylcarbamoyltransferase complex dimerization subunit type 1 TsaB n=1 Tax=Candidatus Aquiluna sp. IMCC13023 TaxID=1081644 RepID=UPI0002F681AF|nr:tRNA (adenosine(37)-N6)-threonylcarbamoyltransferase complex dimerization subunit type 1 TsaB [Candidatus Aquiluna sp. IMCC13023]
MILAIDTSAGTSAAVFDGVNRLSFINFDDRFGHAENIGLAIHGALTEAGIVPADLTLVAIGRGPAPYTGLRVGVAAGIAMSTALEIPACGVITLNAVAMKHPVGKVLVVADAKRKELFIAGFQDGVEVMPPSVATHKELESHSDFATVSGECDAGLIGEYAVWALSQKIDLTDTSALYLRSPDVTPSVRKRVTG